MASDASDASDARLQHFSGVQHQHVTTPSTPPAPGRGTPAPLTHDSSTGALAPMARQLPFGSNDAVSLSDQSPMLNASETTVPQPGTPAPATAAGAPRPDGPATAHDTLEHRRPRRCVVCGVRYVVAFVPEKPEWVRFRCACQDGRWRWCRVHDRALWEQ